MTQHYIGTKQVIAFPQETDGKPGYEIIHPDGCRSWSPLAAFEDTYLPMGGEESGTRITPSMVEAMIGSTVVTKIGEKTTLVRATLINGFEIIESSACVEVANYDEAMGTEVAMTKIRSKIWNLLGFTLQWARAGIKE